MGLIFYTYRFSACKTILNQYCRVNNNNNTLALFNNLTGHTTPASQSEELKICLIKTLLVE